jgi:hypothetical protein
MEITLIWSSDGWCYIPQRKLRQKFFENKQIKKERWEGIIGMPMHIETIPWAQFSQVYE